MTSGGSRSPRGVLAYVGLGANLGDAIGCLRWAAARLASLGPLRVSSLYRSEPLGPEDQPWYWNAVAELETGLAPRRLFATLQSLEVEAGRPPPAARLHWGPRLLDLDLLLYGSLELREPDLRVPHSRFAERRFVLAPLAELAAECLDPRTGKSAARLLAELSDPLRVEKQRDPSWVRGAAACSATIASHPSREEPP